MYHCFKNKLLPFFIQQYIHMRFCMGFNLVLMKNRAQWEWQSFILIIFSSIVWTVAKQPLLFIEHRHRTITPLELALLNLYGPKMTTGCPKRDNPNTAPEMKWYLLNKNNFLTWIQQNKQMSCFIKI